jgi:hypothetical protein
VAVDVARELLVEDLGEPDVSGQNDDIWTWLGEDIEDLSRLESLFGKGWQEVNVYTLCCTVPVCCLSAFITFADFCFGLC